MKVTKKITKKGNKKMMSVKVDKMECGGKTSHKKKK